MTEDLDNIIIVLKNNKPLKANEIANILNAKFKTNYKKKDINPALYKNENKKFKFSGFPFYRWSLLDNIDSSSEIKVKIEYKTVNSTAPHFSEQNESGLIEKEAESISHNEIVSSLEENNFEDLKVDLINQFKTLRKLALDTRSINNMAPLREKYLNTIDLLIKEIINVNISEDILRNEFRNYKSILQLILNNKNFKEYQISNKKNINEQGSLSETNNKGLENNYSLNIGKKQKVDQLSNISSDIKWSFKFDNSIQRNINIHYRKKLIVFKNKKENNFEEFINNLFKERKNHRNPEVDLFFENFEEFYRSKSQTDE